MEARDPRATSLRWSRVRELYHAALDRPCDERDQFLRQACPDDADLRGEVLELCTLSGTDDAFLRSPFAGEFESIPASSGHDNLIGERLGGYAIRGVLGRGGVGVVYEAAQASPQRTVALKVLRRMPLFDSLTDRLFRREGRALAKLEHPGIARIYEAGSTSEGWHYLAMELVAGEPLTRYARRKNLSVREKLELFRQVCAAVHFAHQRGIIHRDLKPGNILVTADGQVKVLDFGLAKILDTEGEESLLPSEIGTVQGTLPYVSPEQVRGETVDTRADVYALGVILCELLLGRVPVEVSGLPLTEAARMICEEAPRVARGDAPDVDSDLVTIILKTLEKSPDRRFASVAALSQDVDRWLQHLPILARPPSATYQLRKFISRRRGVCALGAALAIVVAASAVVNGVLAARYSQERDTVQAARLREAEARQVAEQAQHREAEARSTAERTAEFLQSLFQNANPGESTEPEVTARGLLRRGVEQLENDRDLQPEVRAQLANTLGSIFSTLDEMPEAQRLLEQSLELRRQALGEAHPDVGNSLMELALFYMRLNEREKALRTAGEAIEILQNHFGERHERTAAAYNELATIHFNTHDMASAEVNFRRALGIGAVIHDEPTLAEAQNHYNLGYALINMERMDEGEQEMNSALHTYRKLGDQAGANMVLNGLAQVAFRRKNTVQAEGYMREAVETSHQILHAEHPRLLWETGQLAFLINQNGRTEEALSIYEGLCSTQRKVLGPQHREVGQTLLYMGNIQSKLGKHSLAVSYQSEAVAIWQSLSTIPSNRLLGERANLARFRCNAGQFAEAEAECRSVLEHIAQVDEPQPWIIVEGHAQLARALDGQGRRMEAEEHALFALELAREKVQRNVAGTLLIIGTLFRNRGEFETGEAYYRECLDLGRNPEGHLDAMGVIAATRLGQMLLDLGRTSEAELLVKEAMSRICDVESIPGSVTAVTLTASGQTMLERKLPSDAVVVCAQAIEILEDREEPVLLADALRCHGMALMALGDPVGAESLLKRSREITQTAAYSAPWSAARVRIALGLCLIELGRMDEAREELAGAIPIMTNVLNASSPMVRQFHAAVARLSGDVEPVPPIDLQPSTEE